MAKVTESQARDYLNNAIDMCIKIGIPAWQIAMEVQNALSFQANKEGYEVKVTVVKK